MQTISFRAMGCSMLAILDDAGAAARAALEAVPGWFAAWEQVFSRFRADSELAALNHSAGAGWFRVSEPLWASISAALAAARASDGLVTPTLLDALERAGYDRDFGALSGGAATAQRPPPPPHDWRSISLDPAQRAVALPAGMRLDLGGSAKGWAAAAAASQLAAHGPALVDAGGDIAVSGPRADGSPWPIGVADPRQPDVDLDLLLISSGGVATSGRDIRRWSQGRAERHHLIDPRTGEPAAGDLLTVTVVAPDVLEAELAAKAVFLQGRDAGLAWLTARPHLAGLLVGEDGAPIRTQSLELYRWSQRSA